MVECPSCHKKIKADFGMTTCPHCETIFMVNYDGTISDLSAEPIIEEVIAEESETAMSQSVLQEESAEQESSSEYSSEWPAAAEEFQQQSEHLESDGEILQHEPTSEGLESGDDSLSAVEEFQPPETNHGEDEYITGEQEEGGGDDSTEEGPTEYNENFLQNFRGEEDPDQKEVAENDPLGVVAFDQQADVSQPILYDVWLKDLDTLEIKNEVLAVLSLPDLGLPSESLIKNIKSGELEVEGLNPVVASRLVMRLRHLDIQISWKQKLIVVSNTPPENLP